MIRFNDLETDAEDKPLSLPKIIKTEVHLIYICKMTLIIQIVLSHRRKQVFLLKKTCWISIQTVLV